MTFRFGGIAADKHDGENGVVVPLLVAGGTETVHAGILVEEEMAGVVGDGVPVGVDEGRRRGKFGETFPHDGFRG